MWTLIIAALVFLGLLPPARARDRAAKLRPLERVLIVGDSLAVGLSGPLEAGYGSRTIAAATRAREGSTAPEWVRRTEQAVAELNPHVVLVSLGTNDCVDPTLRVCQEFTTNAGRVKMAAESQGATVVWLIPSWLDWAPSIRGKLAPLEVRTLEAPDGIALQGDGIHPTPAGYAAWARDIVERTSEP